MRVAVVFVGTAEIRSVVAEDTNWGVRRCVDRGLALPLGRLEHPLGSGAGTGDLVRECIRRFRQTHQSLGVQRTRLVIDERRYELVRRAGLATWMAEHLGADVVVDRVGPSLAALARVSTGRVAGDAHALLVELDDGRVRVAELQDGQPRHSHEVTLPSPGGLGAVARSSETDRLVEVARAAILPVLGGRGGAAPTGAIAVGREVRAVARHVEARRWRHDVTACGRVTLPMLAAVDLARELAVSPDVTGPGPDAGSPTQLAGTALVLAGLAATTPAGSVTCVDSRPVDGHVLQSFPGRVVDDVPSRFVDAMGRPPTEHGEQVAQLAGALFEGLARHAGLEASDRQILEAAALVHDVASDGDPGDHRRATEQVLSWPVRGVATATQVEVAALVRAQRGRPPGGHVPLFARLPAARRAVVGRLAPLLRLADGLDGGDDRVVQALHVEGDGDIACIHVVGDHVELALHGARAHLRHAEQVLGLSLVVRALRPAAAVGAPARGDGRRTLSEA